MQSMERKKLLIGAAIAAAAGVEMYRRHRNASQNEQIPAHIDQLFIHGQGYRERADKNLDPTASTHGRLEMSATRELTQQGVTVGTVVFSGFAFPGQEIPLAHVDAEALRGTLHARHLPKPSIIEDHSARTTTMEVKTSKRVADETNAQSVAHLTVRAHKGEVQRATRTVFQNHPVQVFTAEDILVKSPNTHHALRYKKFIDKFRWSKQEWKLRLYQAIKYPILHLPQGGNILEKISNRYRPDPSV